MDMKDVSVGPFGTNAALQKAGCQHGRFVLCQIGFTWFALAYTITKHPNMIHVD